MVLLFSGEDGLDQSVFPTINITSDNGEIGQLPDYMGLPIHATDYEVSALPFRGYAKIFNEWYRDQDLVQPLPISTESGLDSITNTDMQTAAWEKDYFTSARPFTQKGPEVTIPIGDTAPVHGTTDTGQFNVVPVAGDPGSPFPVQTGGGGELIAPGLPSAGVHFGVDADFLIADLSNATGASIIDVRTAFALQRYEEARARYGSRYSEYLRHLGVRSSDARLQRPEFLGGGRQTIQFSEVLATAQDNEGQGPDINIGELKGHGIGAMRSNRYRRFFEEHGYVYTFLTVKPKTMYHQGIVDDGPGLSDWP